MLPDHKIKTKHLGTCLHCKEYLRMMKEHNFCSGTCRKGWVKAKMKKEKGGHYVQVNEKTWVKVLNPEDAPRVLLKWQKLLGNGIHLEKPLPIKPYIKKEKEPIF